MKLFRSRNTIRIIIDLEVPVAAIDDLNNAVADLTKAVDAAVIKLHASTGVDPAAVETAVTAVNAAVTALTTATA